MAISGLHVNLACYILWHDAEDFCDTCPMRSRIIQLANVHGLALEGDREGVPRRYFIPPSDLLHLDKLVQSMSLSKDEIC